MHLVWTVFLWTAAGVAVVVYGCIGWCIVRYRKRGDHLPPQFRNNIPLEITYTVIPLLIVAALFGLTYEIEARVEHIAPDPAAVIDVKAFDWSWQFAYRGTSVAVVGTPAQPPVMAVPVGKTVQIVLTSADVAHSLYVPAFLFKRDAIPGLTNRFDLTVTVPGRYRGECVEYCGLDHTRMTFVVDAMAPGEFAQWLRTGGRSLAP